MGGLSRNFLTARGGEEEEAVHSVRWLFARLHFDRLTSVNLTTGVCKSTRLFYGCSTRALPPAANMYQPKKPPKFIPSTT